MELKGKALKPNANRTASQRSQAPRNSANEKNEKRPRLHKLAAKEVTRKVTINASRSTLACDSLTKVTLSSERKNVESVVEEAERLLSLPPSDRFIGTGSVRVRFNHYNKAFPVHNGVLKWSAIDEEYCLSFVYKGNFIRDLFLRTANKTEGRCPLRRDDIGVYFLDLQAGAEYDLIVQEVAVAGIGAEGLRLRDGPLAAHELGALRAGQAVLGQSSAVQMLTEELKSMNPNDLSGEKARDLIERRDIEDILFS